MGVTPTAPPSPNSGRNLSPAEPSRWAPAPAKPTPAEILDNNCQKDRSSCSPPVHPLFPLHPRNSNPKMGDLPEARVRPSRPFSKTGSDYAGPFWVRPNSLRNSKKIKAYTCIFVCMATKAVHIEVAEDLTTDSFLAALSRFSNRRGAPTDLYTDCGTNYVGADNELKRIVKELNENLHALPQPTGLADFPRTTFHFNPPGAPHFGGLWEAAVKSMKKHIHKVTLDQSLTIEEFRTLVIKVEAMLNSRPITAISSDPSDPLPLTPAHFLTRGPLLDVPERDHEGDRQPAKRWHRIQAMSQAIWRRWNLEYLQTLESHHKWTKSPRSLEKGQLVLIHDPHTPPLR